MKNVVTTVIAEVGVNHNGSVDNAKRLIDLAADAGADCVKFQTFKADRLVTPGAQKAAYQKDSNEENIYQYEMLKKLELTHENFGLLQGYCKRRRIEFLSTGFDEESIRFLVSIGQKMFKVPSGEITNLPLLRCVAQYGLPIILSTGMATMDEVEEAVEVMSQNGASKNKITVLHCTSEYPAPRNSVNLRAMQSIATNLGVDVGYSDHTLGLAVPIAAVALGARIIEKHLTLDRQLPGPDHKASMEPHEFKMMVKAIREIELALGDGVKRPTNGERDNIACSRRSIVASTRILKGTVFAQENLAIKRPGYGISPMRLDEVIGQKARREFYQDELIEL